MTDSKNQQREPLTTKRFVWASVLITIGFALCLAPVGGFSGGFFLAASIVTMSRKQRLEPVPPRQIIVILICGALLIPFGIYLNHRVPESWDESMKRIMHSPFLIGPLWVIVEYVFYRHWRPVTKSPQRPITTGS